MNQLVTQAIVLSRTDYGEADRIVTVLTPDYGKLRLIAKGVRRVKSKLAGGIELFSVSSLTYIRGRGDIGTLVSSRLEKYYSSIVTDLDRTMLGYELIKRLNKVTEDQTEPEYFELLKEALEALDDHTISLPLIRYWFSARLLTLSGHSPNLHTDNTGKPLEPSQPYTFDHDAMAFGLHPAGRFGADHIKYLRLSFAGSSPKLLASVQGEPALTAACTPLVQTIQQTHHVA